MEAESVGGFEDYHSATRVLPTGSPCASGAVEAAEREPAESAISIHSRSTRDPGVAAGGTYRRSHR
jgi:hypothetical protein